MRTNEELVANFRSCQERTSEATEIISELWKNNQRLIKRTVHRLTGLCESDTDFDDMYQQAYFGLYYAVQSFNPEHGKFSTYLVNCIKWELSSFYKKAGACVRLPQHIRQRHKDCMNVKRQLEAETGGFVSNETALKAMGFSPDVISSTLAAFNRFETISLDSIRTDISKDGDGATLLDLIADNTNVEEQAITQEWLLQLRDILFAALQDIPKKTRAALIRHFFVGVPYERIAEEYGVSKQVLNSRVNKAFRLIRAGRYGEELSTFMSSVSGKERAERLIIEARAAIERLQLPDAEKGLLAL